VYASTSRWFKHTWRSSRYNGGASDFLLVWSWRFFLALKDGKEARPTMSKEIKGAAEIMDRV
jgi:hypothetical protein